MENASKALIMAGTILIGILLIALLVYFFNSVLGVDKAYNANINTTRIAYGIPVGGELKYADEITLLRAFEGRRSID